MTRQAEVRELLRMSAEDLQHRAGERLIVLDDVSTLHWHFAESIAAEIQTNNQAGRPTKLILPVGPVGQYPLLAEMVNQQQISLQSCWFFMMDEHCDDAGIALLEHARPAGIGGRRLFANRRLGVLPRAG